MRAGDTVIASHYQRGHGVLTYTWTCTWVTVQERKRIAVADLTIRSSRFGDLPPKHGLAIPEADWKRLRALPCDLCGQPIGGENA